MIRLSSAVLGVLLLVAAIPQAQEAPEGRFWAQWRGPLNTGVSPTANLPLEWSETQNIRWKVEIPGRGFASPVVWDDRIFVTTAVPMSVAGEEQHEPRGGEASRGLHQFRVMAIDRDTGRTLWDRVADEQEPHEAGHPANSTWASSSPLTDGERVYAYFESFGLYAYDLDGTLIWEKDFGDKRMRNEFGEGSTPALFGNTLVIVWDHLNGDSSIMAVDARTGEERWRVPRDEITPGRPPSSSTSTDGRR